MRRGGAAGAVMTVGVLLSACSGTLPPLRGQMEVGRDAFAYRSFGKELERLGASCYAGIELACLDACGQAEKRR